MIETEGVQNSVAEYHAPLGSEHPGSRAMNLRDLTKCSIGVH